MVVKAMNDHASDERLLEHACHVLLNLSCYRHHQNEADERRALIGQAGGVEAVTNAMQHHPSFVALLECACSVLRNLCVDNDNNARRIDRAGGIKILVDTMKRHATSPKIQDKASWALFSLSFTSDGERKVAEIATEAVVKAKRRFPKLKYPPLLLKRLNEGRLWKAM